MADFCKQCSIDVFGEDFGDLAGLTSGCSPVLCEGCGFDCVVTSDGTCVSETCLKQHGKQDREGDETVVVESLVANRFADEYEPAPSITPNYDDVQDA